MHRFDLSPLFRSTVGFDRLASLLDTHGRVEEQTSSYPPYNIEKLTDDTYRISMAVAGFGPQDISVVAQPNSLVVTGKITKDASDKTEGKFLHRGIAARAFERRFELADHIAVTNASLEHGLLHVELKREVPEAMKPRIIEIVNAGAPQRLESAH
ncbi:Hsp20 family protein [Lacibacterium aquatile]|uniref:Hsp20 family protein n=1 Tax=Lacibacterium aquatile TaxID=1168082 RepID=A0ABW5DPR8_9PROT